MCAEHGTGCGAAAVTARRDGTAAAAGVDALPVAQPTSNGVCEQISGRPRPPAESIPTPR
ncbi:hypothetical protein [Streptomyces sp. NPDC006668]|uniref:hypothetical protein n=1 Tax=Streptomyces sp. NPDC006668 TaxID=3156903 RepID=UPI0033F810AD